MAKQAKSNTETEVVDIDIESGWTPPVRESGYVQNWPLEKLKEGQSFFIKLTKDQKEGSMRHALQTLCKRKSEEHERNYTAHASTKDGVKGFRIMRQPGVYKAAQKMAA